MRVVNKKALFDYDVLERLEAGIVLSGAEVKSVRQGRMGLSGARAEFEGDELWLAGMTIDRYDFAADPDYQSGRRRKLLLRRRELASLQSKRRSEGLTLVPLAVYNKGNLIKVDLGLVRGKKKYEKREKLKKRSEERKIARLLKS